jgi:S-formylglutathione hydrolase FrmB
MNSYFKFQFFQILLLLTSTLALSQDSRVFDNLKMESKILGQERSYAVYLPSDYDTSNRSYPVLYLLHGLGDDQTGWIKLGDVQRITDESINSGISSPMIIVMPDAGSGIVGYINQPNRDWLYEDFFFEELLPHVESKYRIKKGKQYRAISGLSMGGGGTLVYALHKPDLFSSAAPLSPAIGPTDIDDFHKWISRYNFYFNDKIETQKLLNANHPLILIDKLSTEDLNSVAWYLDCGDDDYLYEDSSLLHLAMKKKGIKHEYRVRDGAHTWHYWKESLPKVLGFVSINFHQH